MRFPLPSIAVLLLFLAAPSAALAQQENVLDVGSRSQLLFDPAMVYESGKPRVIERHKRTSSWDYGCRLFSISIQQSLRRSRA
jgi:hypothetical protein